MCGLVFFRKIAGDVLECGVGRVRNFIPDKNNLPLPLIANFPLACDGRVSGISIMTVHSPLELACIEG